jgi:transcription initiation factor TFIID subunit TAF12
MSCRFFVYDFQRKSIDIELKDANLEDTQKTFLGLSGYLKKFYFREIYF